MIFERIINKDLIDAKKKELGKKREEIQPRRRLISAVSLVPSNRELFKELRIAIWNSGIREKSMSNIYYIEGTERYFLRIIPCPEYYKTLFSDIDTKLYGLSVTTEAINGILNSIQEKYTKTRTE